MKIEIGVVQSADLADTGVVRLLTFGQDARRIGGLNSGEGEGEKKNSE